MTGKKIYTTNLNNGSKVVFIDADNDECKLDWQLNSEQTYDSNPAFKHILINMQNKSKGGSLAIFPFQDCINFFTECKSDEIESKISLMKRFSNLSFTQKDFEEAKRKTIEDLDCMHASFEDELDEFTHGRKYANEVEYLKTQVENMTLEQLVQQFNGMIANSSSTIVVKAPFSKNPQLMNQIANNFDSSNFAFKQNFVPNPTSNNSFIKILVKIDNTKQNTIIQQYDFPISGNPKDNYTFKILANVLSNMNFDSIREKQGLAYSSFSAFKNRNYIGNIFFVTDSTCSGKDDIPKILNSYKTNIDAVLKGHLTDEDLIFAKNELKGSLTSIFQNEDKLMYWLLDSSEHIGTIESIGEIQDIIDSITIEDVQRAANYVFKNKPRYFSSITQDVYDKNKEFLEGFGDVELRIN